MADEKDQKKILVHFLRPVGPYLPGQEAELLEADAVHVCDGKRAVLASDAKKSEEKDFSKLSVKEMSDLKLKNVQVEQGVVAAIEKAALEGVPVASAEPVTVTGGVTPPSLVFPAMMEAAGLPSTDVKTVRPSKKDEKKEAAPKAEPKK